MTRQASCLQNIFQLSSSKKFYSMGPAQQRIIPEQFRLGLRDTHTKYWGKSNYNRKAKEQKTNFQQFPVEL